MAEEGVWLFLKRPIRNKEVSDSLLKLLEKGTKVHLFLQLPDSEMGSSMDLLVEKGLDLLALDRSFDKLDHEWAILQSHEGPRLQINCVSFQPIRGVKRLVTEIEDYAQVHRFLEDFQRGSHPFFPVKG